MSNLPGIHKLVFHTVVITELTNRLQVLTWMKCECLPARWCEAVGPFQWKKCFPLHFCHSIKLLDTNENMRSHTHTHNITNKAAGKSPDSAGGCSASVLSLSSVGRSLAFRGLCWIFPELWNSLSLSLRLPPLQCTTCWTPQTACQTYSREA